MSSIHRQSGVFCWNPAVLDGPDHCSVVLGLQCNRLCMVFKRGSRILVRGPSGVLTPRGGGSEPKICSKWGFSNLKLPENCPLDPLLVFLSRS